MKEETKKKIRKITLSVTVITAIFYLLKRLADSDVVLGRLEGELKNVKDINKGLHRTIERQAFTIGKLHNQIHKDDIRK